MNTKKIGVLGCGMIAELGHLPALQHVPGIRLHAVYDVSWGRALAIQSRFQIPHAFPSEKAFWESDIDAVNREEHSFELRNSYGTQWLAWHPEKNFAGMHSEFAYALNTGDRRDMPTAMDGLVATRLARLATEEAIRDREHTSQGCPSRLARAQDSASAEITSPLDLAEPDDLPASTLSALFERTRQQ